MATVRHHQISREKELRAFSGWLMLLVGLAFLATGIFVLRSVATCGTSETSPVINTGTLYS